MNLIKLEIITLSTSVSNMGTHSLALGEVGGSRKFIMLIGTPEAHAINLEITNTASPRPLTHDVTKAIMDEFDISITEVRIVNVRTGIFEAQIIVSKAGIEAEIDSRPSDAIALALKAGAPIYITEEVLNQVATEPTIKDSKVSKTISSLFNEEQKVDASSATSVPSKSTDYSSMSDAKLEELLSKAISEEDYEKAARIRDEMKQRGL